MGLDLKGSGIRERNDLPCQGHLEPGTGFSIGLHGKIIG